MKPRAVFFGLILAAGLSCFGFARAAAGSLRAIAFGFAGAATVAVC